MMDSPYNQFGKRSKRSEVTRGSNPNKCTSNILQPPIAPVTPGPSKVIRPFFERWICYLCKKFESDTEEGLLNHLHRGHNA